MVENVTPGRGYQEPSAENFMDEDVLRIIAAFRAIDADVVAIIATLATKAALDHGHQISEIVDLVEQLAGKSSVDHVHGLNDLSDVDVVEAPNNRFLKKVAGVWIAAAITLADLDAASFNANSIAETAERMWVTPALLSAIGAKADAASVYSKTAADAAFMRLEHRAAVVDLNDATESGDYEISATTTENLPYAGFVGSLNVIRRAASRIVQMAILNNTPSQVWVRYFDGTNWHGWSILLGGAVVNQTITGGFIVTSEAVTLTGTVTPQPGTRPTKHGTNNGAFTLAAPTQNGGYDILVTNGATAGGITFTGFTVSSDTGDSLTTTNGHRFLIQVRRINGVSTYQIKALQ